jgi:hypothetical protein
MFAYDDETLLIGDNTSGDFPTTVSRFDSAEAGMQIDITLTGPESYSLVMDPLGSAATYTRTGNLLSDVDSDYNDDGVVDTSDFVMWRKLNGTGFNLKNEVETPGEVTPDDYTEWAKRFGERNGEIDWIEFVFFNTASNTTSATDLYISSIQILDDEPTFAGGGSRDAGALPEPQSVVTAALAASGVAMLLTRRLP